MRNAHEILQDLELTTSQAAFLLGVAKPTISKWCKRYGLPHVKHGTHHRIVLRDLCAWLRRYLQGNERAIAKLTPTARGRIAAFVEGKEK